MLDPRKLAPLACALFSFACESGLDPLSAPNPEPVLEAVHPSVVPSGSEAATVVLTGLAFVEDAEVSWNGNPRPTSFQSDRRLEVSLESSDLSPSSIGVLTVANPQPGGGISDPVELTVGNPVPSLESITPSTAEAMTTDHSVLEIRGSHFVGGEKGSRVLWNGAVLPTEFVDQTRLKAVVGDHLLQDGRTVEITVMNPDPAGGASAGREFVVTNPVPRLESAHPDSVTLRTNGEVLLSGSNFAGSLRVLYNGTVLVPEVLDSTSARVDVPGELNTHYQVHVRVENPDPGGGSSSDVSIPTRELPPVLSRVTPAVVNSGSDDFTLRFFGSDFAPDAAATWDGASRNLMVLDEEYASLQVTATEASTSDTVRVSIVNPRGGGPSGEEELIVFPPELAIPEGRIATIAEAVNLDGSDFEPLPSMRHGFDAAPKGRAVVYGERVAWSRETGGIHRIFEYDPETGADRRITGPEEEAVLVAEEWPVYSADGNWIYFQGLEVGYEEPTIWRIRRDGTDLERLLPEGSLGWYPAPSPDGTAVTFGRDSELHLLDIETREVSALGAAGTVSRWSPDGQLIAVFRLGRAFAIIRPDGSAWDPQPEWKWHTPVFDWSPDGRYLLASAEDGAGRWIPFLLDVQTGEWRPLSWLGYVGGVRWYGDP